MDVRRDRCKAVYPRIPIDANRQASSTQVETSHQFSLPQRLLENRFIAVKRCKHGLMLYNRNDLFVGRALDLYGEWCEHELTLLSQVIKPGDMVLDVGANVGSHTVALAGLVGPRGSVYAFEPQRLIFQILCANVAINALTNVMSLPYGVSDLIGTVLLPVIDPESASNFGCLGIEGHSSGDGVRVVTLDSFDFDRCHLIKVDAEGLEKKVIVGAKGLIKAYRPAIFVENNSEEQSSDLISMLDQLDYHCWWHLAPFYNEKNFFQNPLNVFPRFKAEASLLCFHRETKVQVLNLPPVAGLDDTRRRVIVRAKARNETIQTLMGQIKWPDQPGTAVSRPTPPAPRPLRTLPATITSPEKPTQEGCAGSSTQMNESSHLESPTTEDLALVLIEHRNKMALADLHYQAGRLNLAEEAYKEILEAEPAHPAARFGLARIAFQSGDFQTALDLVGGIMSLQPEDAEAHSFLSQVLAAAGRLKEAIDTAYRVIELEPERAEGYHLLAKILAKDNHLDEAVLVLRQAVSLEPNNQGLLDCYRGTLSSVVPKWHFEMLNDPQRNQFFAQAIQQSVRPGRHVLEIGTGAGLLAMVAAQAGAGLVTTCEMVKTIAERAKAIIAQNGFGDLVRVISKKSTDLVLGQDIPEPADLLITEIFSCELLAENVLTVIEDAKKRLLKPGAGVIPQSAAVRGLLVGGQYLAKSIYVDRVLGLDLRLFNEFSPQKFGFKGNDLTFQAMSEEFDVFVFNFKGQEFFPASRRRIEVTVTQTGLCLGVLQWIKLDLTSEIAVENHPHLPGANSHWEHVLYTFPDPLFLEEGQIILLNVEHNRVNLNISLNRVMEAKTAARANTLVRAA